MSARSSFTRLVLSLTCAEHVCVKSVFKKQNISATCLQYEGKKKNPKKKQTNKPTLLFLMPEVVSLFSKAWAQGCAATAVTLLGMAGWGEAGAYWYLQATGKGDCVLLSIHRPAQVDFVLIITLRVGTLYPLVLVGRFLIKVVGPWKKWDLVKWQLNFES